MTITLNGTTGITSTGITETSDGNVGIGTSSPGTKLEIARSANAAPTELLRLSNTGSGDQTQAQITFYAAGTNYAVITGGYAGAPSLISNVANTGYHAWQHATNEQMRLDSSGNLLVGTTNLGTIGSTEGIALYSDGRVMSATNGNGSYFARTGTDGAVIYFRKNTSTVGNIAVTGSTTTYNTSSDYRLKEDWQPMTGASERVKALKPVNFAWKADGSRVDGFLAHEAQAIVPEAVTGEKDAVELVDIKDEQGNVTGQEERPVYQGIDQSKLVPLLTAALQEALAKIDDLTARVSALEATNV